MYNLRIRFQGNTLFSIGGIFGTIPATWGFGNNLTDWNVAAEEAARRVHEANPDLLIFVGGIVSNVVLLPAQRVPIRLPDQVITIDCN